MEDKMKENAVSYYTLEAMLAREERHIRRLIILLAITIAMLFASNAAWLYCWQMYDYSGQEIMATQDGEGINIVSGEDVDYGAESSNSKESAPKEEQTQKQRNEKETE